MVKVLVRMSAPNAAHLHFFAFEPEDLRLLMIDPDNCVVGIAHDCLELSIRRA
jgi:hypothetical protein